ncbi:MAG: hypothetical protein K0R80_172 [Clostridia bacterium]|jgi:uncharacterized membrane protein YcjF (UPF0283 family)|nr:hypothetical protein [Clostridia bacterium]
MNEDDARKIAKAFFDEQEERDRIAKEREKAEEARKQKSRTRAEALKIIILVVGIYVIWQAMKPILEFAGW